MTIYLYSSADWTITRQGGHAPERTIQVSRETNEHLIRVFMSIKAAILETPRCAENLTAAWQDVLSVYFAHWEE